ncbi:uncharacterized protein LOC131182307 [Hevea brasiliensis]|uniref:uncharacterized protein LOC131182307 n=1 Tax=Hevea brasiliensis TaxID=3981 RepID=UPI0025CBEB61|nr:uncharacterized protein LOC131182307 [Hevea brasiliensis]
MDSFKSLKSNTAFLLYYQNKGENDGRKLNLGKKITTCIYRFQAKPQIESALHSGDHTNLVDSKLLQTKYNEKEMKIMISCAAACVYKPSSSRPKMNQIVRALEGYMCIEEIWNEKNDNIFLKVISPISGTSLAFPTGIDSTLSNGAQGPDPSFRDSTPTNGRDDPPDSRLPNGGEQVQSISTESESVDGKVSRSLNDGENGVTSRDSTLVASSNGVTSRVSTLVAGSNEVEAEWIEQYEPDVYITLVALRDGTTDLKRVRFSRRRFTEQQAETWWSENRENVYEKYNIVGSKRATSSSSQS